MSLTARQLACLRAAANGHTRDATARALGIDTRTVNRAIRQAVEQLGANDLVHAVGIAYHTGLLQVTPVDDQQVAIVRLAERMGCWITFVPGRVSE